jgi:hypothetical protein
MTKHLVAHLNTLIGLTPCCDQIVDARLAMTAYLCIAKVADAAATGGDVRFVVGLRSSMDALHSARVVFLPYDLRRAKLTDPARVLASKARKLGVPVVYALGRQYMAHAARLPLPECYAIAVTNADGAEDELERVLTDASELQYAYKVITNVIMTTHGADFEGIAADATSATTDVPDAASSTSSPSAPRAPATAAQVEMCKTEMLIESLTMLQKRMLYA